MISYKTWMADTPEIHNKRLKHICLPATHYSGTASLRREFTPNPSPELKQTMKMVKTIRNDLEKVPHIGNLINPSTWVHDEVTATIKDLARTTTKSVGEQLEMGIRSFDFRILYHKSDRSFYTYHGLIGNKFTKILDEIEAFLASTEKELLYICFGHWEGFDNNFDEFSSLVKEKLGRFAYKRECNEEGIITNNPFEKKLKNILNQDGLFSSRVILVNEKSEDAIFWPSSYNPSKPNKEEQAVVGSFTASSKKSTVIKEQKKQFQYAKEHKLPFALCLNLTPSNEEAAAIVLAQLSTSLDTLGASIASNPLYWPTAARLECMARELSVYKEELSYNSLEALSVKMNKKLSKILNEFQAVEKTNQINFIFTDYFENSSLVDLAIAYNKATTRYIKSLDATVTRQKFYESGFTAPKAHERVYSKYFTASQSRYICWELNLSFPKAKKDKKFSIEARYYNEQGEFIAKQVKNAQIKKGWCHMWSSRGWGNKYPGYFWKAGQYYVELWVEGEKISSASFYIKEEIEALDAFIKDLRFYESAYDAPQKAYRSYNQRFTKEQSRYICWELNLEFIQAPRREDFTLEAIYYNPKGEELCRMVRDTHIKQGWNHSWHSRGWGFDETGKWESGEYQVELLCNQEAITKSSFIIE